MSPPSTTASAAGDPARTPRTVVVIPTLNEEASISGVIRALPRDWVSRIIVADGGSTDATAARAREAGAEVIAASRGYGRACLAGAQAASDAELVAPIRSGKFDFVIASRLRGTREPGSIGRHQIAAGLLAGLGMRLLYGVRYTDMCALRAIGSELLLSLGMDELS